jgi:uncharacterized membrane protein (UPF0127 family)
VIHTGRLADPPPEGKSFNCPNARNRVENPAAFAQVSAMYQWRILVLGLAIVAWGGCASGCKKAAPTAAEPDTSPPLPTAAQPKLQTMKLWLGAEEMVAELALTPDQVRTGMMFRTNLAENAGMLFVFGAPYRTSFWMKNCPLPLSAAYIDPDGTILEIHDLQPHNTNSVVASSDRVQFVLETNQGWFQRHHVTTGMVVRTEHGSLLDTFFRQR